MQDQDYDPYGHVITVRDSATSSPYWRLTDVDSAGRFRQEVFGNAGTVQGGLFAAREARLPSLNAYSRLCGAGLVRCPARCSARC